MEKGVGIPSKSPKGSRNKKTLNRLRSKIRGIFKKLQEFGLKDISKATERKIVDFFFEWHKGYSVDYAKRFKALWHWWMTKNRREEKPISDITEYISTSFGSEEGRPFVWIKDEDFPKFRSFFWEDSQVEISFNRGSLIRAPTEMLSLKVENIYEKMSKYR